jgi:hypothetical protein
MHQDWIHHLEQWSLYSKHEQCNNIQKNLANKLADDEGVEVDAGYKGHDKFKTPTGATSRVARKQKSVVRGQHKNVNGHLKIYDVLNVPFQHNNPWNKIMEKHGYCFDSTAVLVRHLTTCCKA